jgi:hypothetical protein
MMLWVLFGAVRGADDWQVSGGGFATGLLVAGGLLGLLAPPREPRSLATGALLIIPGLATLVVAGPGAHPGAAWWYLTLMVGLFGAAGAHRIAVEVRRMLCRRSALAGGSQNR